ncbi:nucleotidyltransferase-like protein [Paenibacillus physcomitrellae]|uniref:Nucleotidyltransferase-like domain-containing protein n=1 Tax=Paenibacillus physcomitrellae TaxID=1619311 RepID=A0ABQ1GUS0_9BACL|nr:nucleotidyltransferase-like protein [Paenibacillus physcomitrellae]GGA50715.1 hypothetical protein GCM10010917_40010 [Paenibacillus physcomitrellae]
MKPLFINDEIMSQHACGAVGFRHSANGIHDAIMLGFDYLILIVCKDMEHKPEPEHAQIGMLDYQLLYVTSSDLENWVMTGENAQLLSCFLQGEIIWDEREELEQLRGKIIDFEQTVREKRKFKEFARFLRFYHEAKALNQNGHFFDAYAAVVRGLQHLGRLELLERNIRAEEQIWEQLHALNTPSYKLYSEMSCSMETLEQRLQLALLAFEFSATSKMTDSCVMLLRILRSRKEPWSLQELMHRAELQEVREELPMVLRKLVYRSVVKQTTNGRIREAAGQGILYWA